MSQVITKTLNQIKILLLCGVIVLVTQNLSNLRTGTPLLALGTSAIGMISIIAICAIALKIKEIIPVQIPAFAWASLLSLLLTTPWSPVAGPLIEVTKGIGAGQIGTVILAIAGISIGTKLSDIKKLSWKIVLVAIVVFIGTFFGSAAVSHLILTAQGII